MSPYPEYKTLLTIVVFGTFMSMAHLNRTTKKVYAEFSIPPRFKLFDDIEDLDLDGRSWSILVRVEVKFGMNRYADQQHFILLDTTGSKIEAIAYDRHAVRFNTLLTEGCTYTLHGVRFQPNWEGAGQFRNIRHMYECSFNDCTTVEPYNMSIQFSPYPMHLTSFGEVNNHSNKTFVDIAGIVVRRDILEHIGRNPVMEFILLDTRRNIIVLSVWCEHLTRHMVDWSLAATNNDVVLGTMLKVDKFHGCL